MSIKPTESELEILNVLWTKGASTVRGVHEAMEHKDAGYTTTLKLMQIMHEKKMLDRDTSNRTHIYKAAINQEHTQVQIVQRLIDTVFNGSAMQLVMQTLGNRNTTQTELDEIRKYLVQMESDSKDK